MGTGRKMKEAMENEQQQLEQQPLISDCDDQLFVRSVAIPSASTNITQAERKNLSGEVPE